MLQETLQAAEAGHAVWWAAAFAHRATWCQVSLAQITIRRGSST